MPPLKMLTMNRRQLLKQTALLTGYTLTKNISPVVAAVNPGNYRIGACDWSIGGSSDPAAFDIAKQIGLKGIQVNMGSLENNMHLRDKTLQQEYLLRSKETGVQIDGLALAELNSIPYKSDGRTDEWVWDSIDVAKALGVKVILLAFFENNDLRKDDTGKKAVIEKLKKVAPKAEKEGVVLGIESYLTATEHIDIIEKTGSKNVQVYYDFRNAADAGNNIYKEIKLLGKQLICECHCKENGYLLGKGSLDFRKIRLALDEIGYKGWLQIEGAVPKDASVVNACKANLRFMQQVFG
jgi:L-ribulose-5-phosphate 3-epimerase